MAKVMLDYIHRIPPETIARDGGDNVIGVSRYLSFPTKMNKVIGSAEYNELVAAGYHVTLNWEYDANDWLGGRIVGESHATEAVRQARVLNYPPGREIMGSADFDMTRAQWVNSGRAYAIAFATKVRAGGYRPGVYGPWDILQWIYEEKIMDVYWQAGMSTAWSSGRNANRWPHAHLIQRGHRQVGGQDTDWNEVLIDPLFGRKSTMDRIAAVTDTAKPTTDPTRTSWYFGNGILYVKIVTWPERNDLIAGGAVEKPFNAADDWKGWVGRTEISALATPVPGIQITQEQLNAAIAANTAAIGAAIANHLRVV